MAAKKYLWTGSDLTGSKSLAKELGYLYGAAIEEPDWNQLHEIVKRMNGIDLNELVLLSSGKGSILIGGGNDNRFIVTYFPDANSPLSSLTLTDLSLTGPDIELTVQTSAKFPAKMCINLSPVLKVLKHFFLYAEIPKDVRWEIDDSGKEATWV